MVIKGKGFSYLALMVAVFASLALIAPRVQARPALTNTNMVAKLVPTDESSFSQNQVLFYDPSECAIDRSAHCNNIAIFDTLNDDDPTPTGEVDGSQITFIGDSIVGMAGEEMFNQFFEGADYGPAFNDCNGAGASYICSGKDVYTSYTSQVNPGGISILEKIVEKGELRPILVFELGGNSPSWQPSELEQYMDKILELAGPNTQIVLFTNYWPECFYQARGEKTRENYKVHNEFIRQVAREHDNVIAGDWASVGKDELYDCGIDNMHPTYNKIGSNDWNGFQVFYKFMYDTIASLNNDNCSSIGLLPGNSLAEQTWNFFVEADIPGLSDNAAAISGIIGNLKQESGLNAFAGGLYGDFSGSVQRKLFEAGLGQYWGSTVVPENILSEALRIGLTQLSQENERFLGTGWATDWGYLKMLDKVKNKTPEAYSDLFEVTVEGAVTGDTISPYTHTSNYIEDDVAREIGNRVFGGNPGGGSYYQEAGTRRQYAREFFDEFGKNSITSSNAISSDYKNTEIHSPSSIVWDQEGWITKGMDGYIKDPGPNLGTRYNSGKPNKILLHYTQGGSGGGMGIYANPGYAPHFTIDLPKRQVWQHHPLSEPSGAVIDSDDVRDIVQIEIAGFGFLDDNPDNPDSNSRCLINGVDYTDRDYCFAKFTDEDWDYLAKLLIGISDWGKDNEADIPLTTEATWTGRIADLRMSVADFDATKGIVAHMHAPDYGNHADTGNIWPLIEAAIARNNCSRTNDENSISGAKNADKQATEVGKMWFDDHDTNSMKTYLENYGDLAFRTGQAYDVPWVAILVQARYEDGGNPPEIWCGSNNAWGIACSDNIPGHSASPGGGVNYANLGEGFDGYGKSVHNGNHDEALKYPNDAKKYILALSATWKGSPYEDGINNSIDALQSYIDSPEGQAVVAKFGAANCGPSVDADECGRPEEKDVGNGDVLKTVEYLIELANKNGSTYTWGGGHPMQGSIKEQFDGMLNNSKPLLLDCTGFASLVMYKTYGKETTFASMTIFNDPLYVEVERSDVRPGDIFVYNAPSGHGGIVIEASSGKVTKIAETGGVEGRSGLNNNIGYSSGDGSFSISNMNGPNGHFFRWKGSK